MNKKLFEGEVLDKQQPTDDPMALNESINKYFLDIMNKIKDLVSKDAMIEALPILKDVFNDTNSPYNASVKDLSNAVSAYNNIDMSKNENIANAITGFIEILNKLNEFNKAVLAHAEELKKQTEEKAENN